MAIDDYAVNTILRKSIVTLTRKLRKRNTFEILNLKLYKKIIHVRVLKIKDLSWMAFCHHL